MPPATKKAKTQEVTKRDQRRMEILVEKMKKVHLSEPVDYYAAYKLYRESEDDFDHDQREWMRSQLGKPSGGLLMPAAPKDGFPEPPRPSSDNSEAPKKIVPKKKRGERIEISDKEIKHLADWIEKIVADNIYSKSQIISEMGDDPPKASLWIKATHLLIEDKRLQMTGIKKGARYSKFGTKVEK